MAETSCANSKDVVINDNIHDFGLELRSSGDRVDNCSDIIENSVKVLVKRRFRTKLAPVAEPVVEKTLQTSHDTQMLKAPSVASDLSFQSQLGAISEPVVENIFQGSPTLKAPSVVSELSFRSQLGPISERMVETEIQDLHATQLYRGTSNISELSLLSQLRPSSPRLDSKEKSHLPSLYDLTSDSDSELSLPSQLHVKYLTNSQTDNTLESPTNYQLNNIHEQLATQNFHQNYFLEQNQRLLKQMQHFESYVSEKMHKTERQNSLIIKTLNDILRREGKDKNSKTSDTEDHGHFMMPKLPISKLENVILLNTALKKFNYLDKFVTQLSFVIKIYENNTRKSLYSVMSKMFTLNLLVKYSWAGNTSARGTLPFASLDGILKVINQLLSRYSSGIDIENELKKFLKHVPRIYYDVNKKKKKDQRS